MKYVRLTLEDGKRLTLEVVSESERFVTGFAVDKNGDRVCKTGADAGGETITTFQHMIERAAIKKTVELRENLKYGGLEVAK